MKYFILSALVAGCVVVGCASTDAPPAADGGGGVNFSAPNQQTNKRATETMVAIPPGAQFTIYCTTITGANNVELAKAFKARLEQASSMKGMRDWYIVHKEGQSILYYGFYKTTDAQVDAKEAARARDDHKRISSLINTETQEKLFPYCPFMALDSKDPAAPPEWNLENAKGYWSLQIGAFMNTPDRKERAVKAVMEARAQNPPIPAYYYHGPTVSSVCVGAWPISAVKKQETDTAHTDASAPEILVVQEGINVPKDVVGADGQPIQVMQPKVVVLDADMIRTMKQFQWHAVNGYTRHKMNAKKGATDEEVESSFLVVIPQKGQGNDVAGEQIVPDTTLINPTPMQQQQPTQGRLRSLERN